MSDGAKILTRTESHRKVLDLLSAKPKGSILDIPAGRGALAAEIRKMDFAVQACDIDVKLFEPTDIPIKYGNMNEALPYEDGEFRYIASVAGIHRVHNFGFAIKELYRILEPDGEMILTFPNYSNMDRRVRYLLRGSCSRVVDAMAFHEHYTAEHDGRFRQLLLFPQVYSSLIRAGFQVRGVLGDKLKAKSLCWAPLSLPIWLGTRLLANECTKAMGSFAILHGGNNILVLAKKPGLSPDR